MGVAPAATTLRRLRRLPLLRLRTVHLPRRELNGGHDLRVGAAQADVAVHGAEDLLVRRARRRLEQRDAGHDHPRGAVAALQRVLVDERLLERVELPAALEALDGRDLLAGRGGGGGLAGADWLAVEEGRCRRRTGLRRSRTWCR
jgi:hypothetical protein